MVIIISRLKRSDIWRDIDTDLADVAADDAADAGLEVEADDDEADAPGRDERIELVHPGKTNKPQIGCSTGTNLTKNRHQSKESAMFHPFKHGGLDSTRSYEENFSENLCIAEILAL